MYSMVTVLCTLQFDLCTYTYMYTHLFDVDALHALSDQVGLLPHAHNAQHVTSMKIFLQATEQQSISWSEKGLIVQYFIVGNTVSFTLYDVCTHKGYMWLSLQYHKSAKYDMGLDGSDGKSSALTAFTVYKHVAKLV